MFILIFLFCNILTSVDMINMHTNSKNSNGAGSKDRGI